MPRRRIPPFLMMNDAGASGGGTPDAGEPAGAPEAAPQATVPPGGEPPKVDAAAEARIRELIAERDSLKGKAEQFDAAEQAKLTDIEKANQRAQKAEQDAAKNAAEKLQLQAAVDNGITKDERVLLTGKTEAEIAAQVAAIIGMRAPGTASAAAAGITGGGAAPSNKPATFQAAIEAALTANK